MLKDISEFKIGDIAESFASNIRYKVMDYNYEVVRNKRTIVSSACLNVETGKEVIITWHKNKNFK